MWQKQQQVGTPMTCARRLQASLLNENYNCVEFNLNERDTALLRKFEKRPSLSHREE